MTLPVLRTIARGCREALRYGVVYTVYAVAWAIIAVLVYRLAVLSIATLDTQIAALVYRAASWLRTAAMLVGYAVIFVAVNRAIVLLEAPAWRKALRVGGRELRVFGCNLVFHAVGYLELTALGLLVRRIGGPYGIDAAALFDSGLIGDFAETVVWGLLICTTLTPFFGLAFSLAAIDTTSRMFRRSFVWSRGHRWRLGAIAFSSGVLVQIAVYAPFLIWADWNDGVGRSVVLGASAVI